jgi:hypothetical protein
VSLTSWLPAVGRYFGFLLVWLTLAFGAAESVESPVQLLLRMQRALGGGDKMAAIVDIDQRVRAVIWEDRARYLGRVVKRVRWVKPRRGSAGSSPAVNLSVDYQQKRT